MVTLPVPAQLYRTCPQVLLPVLPRLGSELHVDSDDKRTAAVNLLGRLFTVPGSDMASQHPQLFDALLLRCKDQKVQQPCCPCLLVSGCAYNARL